MKWTRSVTRISQLVAMVALAALAGCQSYTKQTADMTGAWEAGNMLKATECANKEALERKDGRDGLLWKLEQGTVLRAAGDLPGSNSAFDEAEVKVNQWEAEAKTKLGVEMGATLTNQANTPYRGRAYDKVMMNTYKALNYMALKNNDAARVELNRALQRQRDAVDENGKRIEEAQKASQMAKDGQIADETGKKRQAYDTDRALSDPKTGPALDGALSELNTKLGSYADYVNPFAVFVDGLFFMTAGYDSSDSERARKSIERVAGFNPDNAYIKEDLVLAESVANGGQVPALTYVIFETGQAPYRDELRIDIPLFLVTSKVAYTGASFPRLKFKENYVPGVSVMAGGQLYTTATLSKIDAVVSRDFKNEWPSIVTKTLISTATKAIAQYAAQNAVKDQGWAAQLMVAAGGAIYQAAMNQADLRTWTTLPKEFQYARFTTPEDRKLVISAGVQSVAVDVEPGAVNVVYVRSITPNAPLIISQFALK